MEPPHIFVHLHLYCVPQLHPHFHEEKREVIRKKEEKEEKKLDAIDSSLFSTYKQSCFTGCF